MQSNIDTHTNPAILRSVRNQVDSTTTMQKYYGEIKRNADAAWVMCGNEGAMCNGAVPDCEFRSKQGICNLKNVMALVGLDK